MDHHKQAVLRLARIGGPGATRAALALCARLEGMTFVGPGSSLEGSRRATLMCPRCGRTKRTFVALILAGIVKHACDTGDAS